MEAQRGWRTMNRTRLVSQLHQLGVRPGSVLIVHSSYRAIRPVEGGPSEVIEALLEAVGHDGTLVMPSMTDWSDDEVFDPNVTPCLGMGIIADTFWRRPGVLRSDSPHSFAAYGPHTEEITAPHPPDIPHGPDSPVGGFTTSTGTFCCWVWITGPTRPSTWRSFWPGCRTASRSTARCSKTGFRCASITERSTTAAKTSPWSGSGLKSTV